MYKKIKIFMYRWLPLVFGCHCKIDRTYHIKSQPLPICARCTGELLGILLSCVISSFYIPNFWILLLCMLPMIIDGFLQLLTNYESTNFKRIITGFIFGYAFMTLFILATLFTYEYGKSLNT